MYCVSQKNPPAPEVFLHFFPNGWEFLVQILHAYYVAVDGPHPSAHCRHVISTSLCSLQTDMPHVWHVCIIFVPNDVDTRYSVAYMHSIVLCCWLWER